ncbi:hypothetical protein KKG41_01610 [Patescibacteria group bacterium]|nr:hypothetical protein [Patescibacteria group bacterium]
MKNRRISDKELADLSCNWENSTVDTEKYYQCVWYACEVNPEDYLSYKKAGRLCQQDKGKYYIA